MAQWHGRATPVAVLPAPVVIPVSVARPLFRSVLVVGVAGALTGVVPGVAAAARADATPATKLSRPDCSTSLDDAQDRAATFTVRASRGSSATDFGFTARLQEKPADGSWTTLSGVTGLGSYEAASDGASKMVRRIKVRGLRMGSAYRLKVTYRWVTPDGKRRVTRRSAACTVKELRPNVGLIRALSRTPGTRGDQVVYRTQVRLKPTRTATLADREITISVSEGSTLLGRVTPRPLYHRALVLIPGRACTPGSDVTFRIEVAPEVEESRLADNELTVPCSPGRAKKR